jgi:hypothetical protein
MFVITIVLVIVDVIIVLWYHPHLPTISGEHLPLSSHGTSMQIGDMSGF